MCWTGIEPVYSVEYIFLQTYRKPYVSPAVLTSAFNLFHYRGYDIGFSLRLNMKYEKIEKTASCARGKVTSLCSAANTSELSQSKINPLSLHNSHPEYSNTPTVQLIRYINRNTSRWLFLVLPSLLQLESYFSWYYHLVSCRLVLPITVH